MRINLNFKLESNIIPKEYRLNVISFIKHSLQKDSKNAYYNKNNNKLKPFTFAVFLPNAKINNDNIEIFKDDENKTYINITFSIFDNELFIHFYNAFNRMINKPYSENSSMPMTLKRITMEKEKIIKENKILIKFLSPLVLRNHNREKNKDIYLTFEDKDFYTFLNQSVERLAKEFNFESSKIKLIPINITDESGNIIKKESKTTVVPFKKNLIDVSYGKFCLEGDITLLNNLYKTGIGSRRSEGFGMFDIL